MSKQGIVDSTSGDPITGRIGRFTLTTYRRGDASVQTVYDGVRGATAIGRGKRSLTAALVSAAEATSGGWITVVSLYDAATRVWWPCHIAE